MPLHTDDLRIRTFKPLLTPAELLAELPCDDRASRLVSGTRERLHNILHGTDNRLIVVIGPCSIHDPEAALEFARRLRPLREQYAGALELIMRVYFEKPRTRIGWKGLINDPRLDGSFRVNEGLRVARQLLWDINALDVPAGCEYLDTISPQYISDLVSWGAIGARTTESQIHREMASGLSCPVGFKNNTSGNVKVAVDAVAAAAHPHHFMAVTKDGRSAVAATSGNPDCHVILRGGVKPNYHPQDVDAAAELLAAAKLPDRLMIDASHANSSKKPENQPVVIEHLADRVGAGAKHIMGVMIESHLIGGRQDLSPDRPLRYGQSITDACVDWDASTAMLERLAEAATRRHSREREGVI